MSRKGWGRMYPKDGYHSKSMFGTINSNVQIWRSDQASGSDYSRLPGRFKNKYTQLLVLISGEERRSSNMLTYFFPGWGAEITNNFSVMDIRRTEEKIEEGEYVYIYIFTNMDHRDKWVQLNGRITLPARYELVRVWIMWLDILENDDTSIINLFSNFDDTAAHQY